jgi:hypothetical protein
LNQSKHETEIRRIMEALHKHQNKRSRAARELGISRVGLYKKLQKYGILSPRRRQAIATDTGSQGKEQSAVPEGADVPIYRVESTVRPPRPPS